MQKVGRFAVMVAFAIAACGPARASESDYQDGLTKRREWTAWTHTLWGGDRVQGVFFAMRETSHACNSRSTRYWSAGDTPHFYAACIQAKKFLAEVHRRSSASADYKRGWDAP